MSSVNGESWGLYVNVQQFDKIFLKEHFKASKGTRWKVRGNPGADGGLRYLGDNLAEYKSRFQMKSNDGVEEWKALIELCRRLNETPLDKLEAALEPILDIDETLRFLALDVALVNSDGYWTRASDYSIFREADGKFHIIPHDMNEAFHGASPSRGGPGGPPGRGAGGPPNRGAGGPPGGGRAGQQGPPNRGGGRSFGPPGGGGRPNHGSVDLDPLVSADNPRMPLRSRLLAVPKFRAKYMEYVRKIAQEQLDWKNLGPVVASHRSLITDAVKTDTRKLASYEAFDNATAATTKGSPPEHSLQEFAKKRRDFLLNYKK